MKVELSKAVADELRNTLAEVISDMSSEIADTDNPRFRSGLQERRVQLESVLEQLDGS